jgi:hypothetical protein
MREFWKTEGLSPVDMHRTNADLENRKKPTRFELIDKDGKSHGSYSTGWAAFMAAHHLFPDQSQDPDRTGRGWDISVVGAE